MDNNVKKVIRVEEIAEMLDISRSSAYNLAQRAVEDPEHAPFTVIRLGNSLRVSRRAFEEFLDANNM